MGKHSKPGVLPKSTVSTNGYMPRHTAPRALATKPSMTAKELVKRVSRLELLLDSDEILVDTERGAATYILEEENGKLLLCNRANLRDNVIIQLDDDGRVLNEEEIRSFLDKHRTEVHPKA